MPYRWTNTETTRELTLWPHRSMPKRGFAAVIMFFFTLITVPLYGLLGTAFLWGLLPFVLLTIAGLWWAIEHTYKTAEIRETLVMTAQETVLTHRPPKGEVLEWRCNTYWVTAQIYPSGGRMPFYVTLRGNGREVEIGAFLSEEERKTLIHEIERAIGEMRALTPQGA